MNNEMSRRSFVVCTGGALLAALSTGEAAPNAEGSRGRRVEIEKFRIDIPKSVIADLQARLNNTRWNDAVTDDWSYGTQRSLLEKLIQFWLQDYDWMNREAVLNELPHFRADIDGFHVHFLHFKGKTAAAKPLLLMNGWPSSFIEYQKLAPLLLDGGFEVVMPALPGFGFSDRPVQPHQVRAVDLFFRLMTEGLGYERFAVAGTDIGAGAATRLGLEHPEQVSGVHVTSVVDPPRDSSSAPLSQAEKEYQAQAERWEEEEGAYSSIQSTRPQTLAFGLADSPVGLASWIIEKFYVWSDCRGDLLDVFPMEMLIDNLMVYWVTATIGSSVRLYYESKRWPRPFKVGDRVKPPSAVLVLPKDLALPPREWAERFYNVKRYNLAERGGHFPAWEVTDLYAKDLLEFFRSVG